jgi:hypothetical protein
MTTAHDTTRDLRELASAIASYPVQSQDAVVALAWVRSRLESILATADPPPTCSRCRREVVSELARPVVSLLN